MSFQKNGRPAGHGNRSACDQLHLLFPAIMNALVKLSEAEAVGLVSIEDSLRDRLGRLFFEPLQLYFQTTDLLIEFGGFRLIGGRLRLLGRRCSRSIGSAGDTARRLPSCRSTNRSVIHPRGCYGILGREITAR